MRNPAAIDERVARRPRKLGEGFPHRCVRGLQNIDAIDLRGFHRGCGPPDVGMGGQLLVERLPLRAGEAFGIGQHVVVVAVVEDHGGGYDRPGERTAAGFINPGDQQCSSHTESALVREGGSREHG